jgi:hypothetical protein
VTRVPSATNTSCINSVECPAHHLQDTAIAGSEYRTWGEINDALQRAAALINREHRRRGKQYRDTQDGQRKQ